jgi:hypothetical protein
MDTVSLQGPSLPITVRWHRLLFFLGAPTTVYRFASWRRSGFEGSGRMVVVRDRPGSATVRYEGPRDEDRALCVQRQAWLLDVAARCGGTRPTLRERGCVAGGGTACEYTISWSARTRSGPALAGGLLAAVVAMSVSPVRPTTWLLVPAGIACGYAVERWRAQRGRRLAEAESSAALRWLVARALAARPLPAAQPAGAAGAPAEHSQIQAPRERRLPVLAQEGQFWRIEYEGSTVLLRHSRGLSLLAHLVRSPGVEVHVRELDAITPSVSATVSELPPEGGLRIPADDGDLLDARARAEYRERVADLQSELEDAERCSDLGRAAKIRAEIDVLVEQLRTAVAIGGRGRRASPEAERLRVAITRRIRDTIGLIAKHHPALGAHLAAHVSTGYFCAYDPGAMVGATPKSASKPT